MKMLKRICAMFLTAAIAASYIFSIPISAADDLSTAGAAVYSNITQGVADKWEQSMTNLVKAYKDKGGKADVDTSDPMILPATTYSNTGHSIKVNDLYFCLLPKSFNLNIDGTVTGCDFSNFNDYSRQYAAARAKTNVEHTYVIQQSSTHGTLGAVQVKKGANDGELPTLTFYSITEVFGLDVDGGGGHEWERWYWAWPATGSSLYFKEVLQTGSISGDKSKELANSADGYNNISPPPTADWEVDGLELMYYIARFVSVDKSYYALNGNSSSWDDYISKVPARDAYIKHWKCLLLYNLSIPVSRDGYGKKSLSYAGSGYLPTIDNTVINALGLYIDRDMFFSKVTFDTNMDLSPYSMGWSCIYSISNGIAHNYYANGGATSGNFDEWFNEKMGGLSDVGTAWNEVKNKNADKGRGISAYSMEWGYILLDYLLSTYGAEDVIAMTGGRSKWINTDALHELRTMLSSSFGVSGYSEGDGINSLHHGLARKIEQFMYYLTVKDNAAAIAAETIQEEQAAMRQLYLQDMEGVQSRYYHNVFTKEPSDTMSDETGETILELLRMAQNNTLDSNRDGAYKQAVSMGLSTDDVSAETGLLPSVYQLLSSSDDLNIRRFIEKLKDTDSWKAFLTTEFDAAVSIQNSFYGANYKYIAEPAVHGVIGESMLTSYLESYKVLKAQPSKMGGGFSTLKLRCEIIDFCQEYGCLPDEYPGLNELLTDCEQYYKDVLGEEAGVGVESLCSPLHYGVFAGDYVGAYYAYQVRLRAEICYYERMLFELFAPRFVTGSGFTITDLTYELESIQTLYELSEHYRFVGYTGWLTDNLNGGTNDIHNLAELYSLLVEYGHMAASEYTDDIYDENLPSTLFFAVNGGGNVEFSYNYLEGRSLSATYIPMQTNLYDPYTILDYADLDWVENFQYKYGFHRKALLIDTNPDAAVDYFTTGSQGATRVATLGDLLNAEKDIVLYVDENFYNIRHVTEVMGSAYDRLTSEEKEATFFDTLNEAIGNVNETDPVRVFKHAEIDTYSYEIAQRENLSDITYNASVTQSIVAEDGTTTNVTVANPSAKKYDNVILDLPAIKKYLVEADEYSAMMSYAFVSTIYRDTGVYNAIANVNSSITPVFVSSSQAALVYPENTEAFGSLLNYALIKNVPAMASVGYETSSDMTSPIYVDIYGNIVTESGLVVVPAACNSTLHDTDTIMYMPICSGYLATYGKSWKIPIDWAINEEWMSNFFYKNVETEEWDIRNRNIAGVSMDFSKLSYSEENINKAFKAWYQFDITHSLIMHPYNSLNVLHETMRGAPLDCIDFDAENLNLNRTVDKSGLIAAAKLDSIINSLEWDTENSIMSIPSLSFIDNYQYVVVFVFKILLVIVVTALMITVYVDAMKSSISGKTVLKCLGVLLVGVSSVLILPVSYELSYYQSNKVLLQDEAEYIMMLNTEKNMSGREIGVYQVTEPEQTTQVLLKLEDYKFDWISELPNVIFSDSIDVLDASYQEFLKSSPLINNEIVQVKNDGTYMDVQDIFDTSVLNFSTETKNLYQKVSVDPVASYYTPYYYFLDALLNNMNNYNSVHNIYAYSTKMMRGGQVKTVNLCSAYFNSPEFQDVYDDLLGLYQIYEVQDDIIYDDVFDNSVIEPAKSSQWYVGTFLKEEEVLKRLDLMTTKAQEFVVDNRDLIGKVTDETFLKCMAMSLAIDYNQLFGIPSADALEIYNLSNADLIRLTVADRDITLEDSPMSFARFVYNEAGTPGVYASVFLVITTMFVQTMKTVLTIGIFIILLVSVFVLKILLRKQNHSFAGYLLTLAVICGTNILYALILKVSLFIPTLGIPPTVCIILQVLIQLGYLFILGIVFMFALRDWRNGGFNYYSAIGGNIKNKAGKLFNRFRSNNHGGNGGASGFSSDDRPKGVNGWKYLERLQKQQEKRAKKAGR